MGLAMHAIWSELPERAFGFSRGSTGRGAAPAVSSQLGRTERDIRHVAQRDEIHKNMSFPYMD